LLGGRCELVALGHVYLLVYGLNIRVIA
jgi:hypothetical protein